ncbi:hypothetical protein LWI28_021337 [Acer negundo]|uniref:Uncharacterized protein n=1 Tax=Acer negundo TaxID=4023 RepID=A0AAD5NNY0_ACENE|nr:hypothetical protein LWI28_021337 [Acer negundo]KAK4842959.1 hypothetical protein QYF36_002094 [Acer negundo]
MATAPMKSQPLHNFSLPFLKWGATTTTTSAAATNRSRFHSLTDSSEPENDSDHESTRPLRVGSRSSRAHRLSFPSSSSSSAAAAAKQRKDASERPRKQTTTVSEKEPAATEEEDDGGGGEEETAAKPWNLRPRKAAKNNGEVREALVDSAGVIDGQYEKQKPKSTRLREMVESRSNNNVEKKEKNKFWVSLSRDEIEEDVFVMTGSRPARRPRKRPKNVQKQLDAVFPGLWLVGVTVDAYRVTDSPMKK